MTFAHVLGKINTTILLSVLYFVIIGIYSIISNFLKLLALPFRKKPETYWIAREDEFDPEYCKHPF